jgi:hypothetical protein
LKSKEQNKETKKTIHLKIKEDSSLRLLVTKSSSAKMLANFRRKRGNSEKNLGCKLSIYRGEGGVVSRNCLNMTVASIPEDACPLRHSEGDIFLPEFKSFRGIGSSESTRFPEGLVLGN